MNILLRNIWALMCKHSRSRISSASDEESKTSYCMRAMVVALFIVMHVSFLSYLLMATWVVQGINTPLVQKKLALLQREGLSFSAAGKLTSAPAAVMGVDDFS